MRPTGGSETYDPAGYRPAFTREQIVEHLRDVCEIVEEIDPPADLRERTFDIVQAMHSSMSPIEAPAIEVGNGSMAPALRRDIPSMRRR